MRRRLLLLPVLALLFVAYGSPGVDADEEAKKAPAKPLSLEEAVAQTIEAAAAGDTATLATLAAADNPDPWTVVDELCHRGAHDAAEAFAKVSDRPDVAKLPAYVTAARTRESDEASRQMLAALMEAMRVRSVDRAQAAIADLGPLEETVVRMRLAHGRGVFLQAIGKFKEAEDVLLAAADVAARMGWLRRAFDLYTSAGTNAYRTSSWARARDHWKKAQELAVLRRNRADAAGSLSNLGIVYQMLGEYDQALAAFEAGAQGLAEMGEEVAANQARSNIGNIHFARGDFDLAIAAHERVLAVYEKHGNKVGTARTLGNLANAYYGRGDFP
nr:tetratricopeptide repeat protein [Planctomycetota bacterium]